MSLAFLLEIGTEEIPDWMIPPAINQLRELFQDLLDRTKASGTISAVDATPRRLVLRAEGLTERQPDSEELLLGPPKSAGAGAATGFAKKMGTTPDQLGTETTPKGEYYSFKKHLKGQPTKAILAAELPQLILKISFPKTMYWNGKGTERFIRPIRWIVALLGDEIVPFQLAGIQSGNITQGHRQLGKPAIPVTIQNFDQQLESNGVILSASTRRARIETEPRPPGSVLRVRQDPALLETLVYITEFPTPILGGFDSQYLELPSEVLVTVMRHHQKYFSVEDDKGNLAPHFIAVMNTDGDPEGLVCHGNERVLRARFNDARFFWQQDQKKKLEDRLEDLKNVTFQAKLGSYYDKTRRTMELADRLASKWSDVDPAVVHGAAELCKCDLTTTMVKEFPELQGIMGGLYAEAQGRYPDTWKAIYDHYRPVGSDDSIPGTKEGAIVAVADKLDTLRECFRIGMIPTGSRDPFALRRAAQGVVRICIEGGLDLWLEDKETFGDSPELRAFLLDRVRHYFKDLRGFKYDEVNAVLAARAMRDLPDVGIRLLAVREVRATEDFEPLAESFKRIRNILQQADFLEPSPFNPGLMESGPEKELYEAYQPLKGQVYVFANKEGYVGALKRIAALRPKLDLFFDKVLVNAPDEAVRRNRLTLLHNLLTEFSEIADFSEIVTNEKRETRNEEL
jgi:glycyl-tRNA synthetase beta chain